MLKKALLPVVLILAAIVIVALASHWYESKWGIDGPWPDTHHHGGPDDDHHH